MAAQRPDRTLALILSGCGESEVSTKVAIDLVEYAQWLSKPKPGKEAVRADSQRGFLIAPSGSRADFYLRVPEPAWLVFDHVRIHGAPSPKVRISAQREDGQIRRFEVTETEGNEPIRFKLPDGAGSVLHLSLSASKSKNADSEVAFWAPRIETLAGESVGAEGTGDTSAGQPTPTGTPPNLIFYLVDTLRKDHIGAYGCDRSITPNIDRFAATATIYERAYAQSSWTRPSVASIFTGLEPHLHGVNSRDAALPQTARTLAEILKDAGYETDAFITNGNVGPEFAMDQGFEVFSLPKRRQYLSHQLNSRLSEFLVQRSSTKPLFLYTHSMDPHAPYTLEKPFKSELVGSLTEARAGDIDFLRQYRSSGKQPDDSLRREVARLYDHEVAFNDRYFGEFLDLLRRHGLYDNSWIVLTADHGEEFWDHESWGHGQSLYGELIDIPLIVRAPGQSRTSRSNRLTQHVDLFATALDYAQVTRGSGLNGRSLRREEDADGKPWSVFSAVNLSGREGTSVIEGTWKLIVPKTPGMGRQPLLFDLALDPKEGNNLYSQRPVRAGYMEMLRRQHETAPGVWTDEATGEMSEELREELKALGYLD